MNNKKYYSEAVDSEGNEQNRFKRFGNRFLIGIKSSVRTLILRFKVWLWPSYLWSDAVNICKLIVRTGTRQNESYNIDLMKLMRDAGDGKFKTLTLHFRFKTNVKNLIMLNSKLWRNII